MSCLNCTKRHYNCHSECQSYKEEKAKRDAESNDKRKANASEFAVYGCTTAKAVKQKMHYKQMRRAMY